MSVRYSYNTSLFIMTSYHAEHRDRILPCVLWLHWSSHPNLCLPSHRTTRRHGDVSLPPCTSYPHVCGRTSSALARESVWSGSTQRRCRSPDIRRRLLLTVPRKNCGHGLSVRDIFSSTRLFSDCYYRLSFVLMKRVAPHPSVVASTYSVAQVCTAGARAISPWFVRYESPLLQPLSQAHYQPPSSSLFAWSVENDILRGNFVWALMCVLVVGSVMYTMDLHAHVKNAERIKQQNLTRR